MRTYWIISKILVVSACVWSIWIGYRLWTTPLTADGHYFSEISHLGLTPLVIPVLISLLALWSICRLKMFTLLAATLLLSVYWLVSSFSIGMAYTPAVMLLIFVCGVNLIVNWLNKKIVSEH